MQDKARVEKIVLKKIIDYCEQIENLVQTFGGTFEKFSENPAFQLASSACVIQIGELTTRLSKEFKEEHPDIEWRGIKAYRNIHVHDYENLNIEKAWEVLVDDIPELKAKLQILLED